MAAGPLPSRCIVQLEKRVHAKSFAKNLVENPGAIIAPAAFALRFVGGNIQGLSICSA